ncbi:MAG: hypothetical protein Q4A28_09040 [Brachymonas sp.]|nr:hypothetical protein [Brachymonas sp.]
MRTHKNRPANDSGSLVQRSVNQASRRFATLANRSQETKPTIEEN